MILYFKVFSHVCLIMEMTNRTYSVVLGCHVANTINTFVYNIWTYILYQTVFNKHMFHIKIGNTFNTATKLFFNSLYKIML